MDHTYLGQSGGFAPTIFPYSKVRAFVTSSVDEPAILSRETLSTLSLADNWRRTPVQMGHLEVRK